MVKLTKIYTRSGDSGTTGLGNGLRVKKTDLRVEAYGTVDEANASVGVAVVAAADAGDGVIRGVLESVQHDLFDVGADLCTPVEDGEEAGSRLRIQASQTERLERLIDEHNAGLEPLRSFVLPGGSGLAAALHVARTVTRRAERLTVALLGVDGAGVNPETVRYLNRLSDLLFVLSRVANKRGEGDVLWQPGHTRGVEDV